MFAALFHAHTDSRMMQKPMLEIKLFGELQVARDGAAVRLPPSKKTRALLAFLASVDRPQRRERLISMLWSVPDDPRGALRWSLSKLREILDDDQIKRVVADRDTVALDLSDVSADIDTLRSMAATDPVDVATTVLTTLLDATQGGFLEGLSLPDCPEFQAWHIAEADDLARQRDLLLATLCTRLQDEPEQALPYARQRVDAMPGNATAQAALITLLARLGRANELDAQYQRALADAAHMGQDDVGLIEAAWRDRATAGTATGPSSDGAESEPLAPSSAGDEKTSPQAFAADPDSAALWRRPAIAVLPFENMSGDPEQDYFADGIADDLITALYSWRWIPVIARHSSFSYKGRHVDVVDVGRELGARYVVVGSVRRAGRRIRVSAQLIDASNGHHLWAQRFDREIDDVFEMQDEVTQQIVLHIEPELARAERAASARKLPQNLDAWDHNLRAYPLIRRGRAQDLEEALHLLDESLTLEPDSGRTYALRSYCVYQQALLAWTGDPVSSSGTFLSDARRAVELDESNWLGHALLGMSILWHERDYDTASDEMRRAVQLNPSAALAQQFLGCLYNFDGHPANALDHLAAAQRLNPHSNAGTLVLSDLSLAHLLTQEFDEAVYYARRAISEFGGDIRAWQRLCSALGLMDRSEDARTAFEELTKRQAPTVEYLEATYPFRYDRDRDLFWRGLERAGWRHN